MNLQAGKNKQDENIIVEDGERVKVTKTYQSNGWIRVTIEHDDGTVEELYER